MSRRSRSGCRGSSSRSLTGILILADDLTGAADSAAAFLGRARSVSVLLDARARTEAGVVAVDLDSRSRPERIARGIVRRAFASRRARRAAILFKKVDSTLRGHLSAELAALRGSLGRRAVIFAPAFPAQGRVLRSAKLFVGGKAFSGDARALLSRAGLPATHIDLPAVRSGHAAAAMRAALSIGAKGLVCDAVSDADLDAIARAGLALRPRPLFVGSEIGRASCRERV